jgi:hypothetical protein
LKMNPYTPEPPMTRDKSLISVAFGACQRRSTVEAALPCLARDAATASMKLVLGFELRIASSWLTRRYIKTTASRGMALVIQMSPHVGNWEVEDDIHISRCVHIFISSQLSHPRSDGRSREIGSRNSAALYKSRNGNRAQEEWTGTGQTRDHYSFSGEKPKPFWAGLGIGLLVDAAIGHHRQHTSCRRASNYYYTSNS